MRMTAPTFTSETPFQLNATQENACVNQTHRESEHFKYMAYTITYSVVFPIGFFSNFVALIVFLRFTVRKTANTVFMTNLAISDASFSLTLPFRLVYYFRDGHWDFPDWFCRWCVFSFYLNLYTSILFLTGLSVLRYLAVLHPIRHKTLATVRRASLSCLAIWIFVAFLSTPFLMSGTFKREDKIICFEPRNITSWKRIFILNYVGVSLGFIIPFITILICYGCIFYKLVTGRKIGEQRQITRRRSVYLIVVVLSTFLLCFLPYHIIRTVHLHAVVSSKDCQVREYLLKVLVISLCTAASNSCFNPLLYYFAGETFRKAAFRASLQVRQNSINHSGFYSSFRRRSQTETCQKTRRQSFTAVNQDCLQCSSDKKNPDDCVPEKQFKNSDCKKALMTDKGKSIMICSSKEQRKKSECEE
ncbi:cysteinyl leukotriene receptor 2 [Siphateles boraxobius]|uniref:cysteinyl leukotriene receptor 2 n=1 Tax=Siphateles boraxobius TaxID=180520 RepID=UPI004063270D